MFPVNRVSYTANHFPNRIIAGWFWTLLCAFAQFDPSTNLVTLGLFNGLLCIYIYRKGKTPIKAIAHYCSKLLTIPDLVIIPLLFKCSLLYLLDNFPWLVHDMMQSYATAPCYEASAPRWVARHGQDHRSWDVEDAHAGDQGEGDATCDGFVTAECFCQDSNGMI